MTPPTRRAPLPRLAQAFTAPAPAPAPTDALEQDEPQAPDVEPTDLPPGDNPHHAQTPAAGASSTAASTGAPEARPDEALPPPGPQNQPSSGKQQPAPATGNGSSSRGVRIVAVYVPVAVRDQLRAAAAGDTSQTDVVLTAIEAATQAGTLDAAFTPARPAGALFPARNPARRRRHQEPQVQVTLRLTPDELNTIDRLVHETGAPNRSAYVSAALQTHLDGHQADPR